MIAVRVGSKLLDSMSLIWLLLLYLVIPCHGEERVNCVEHWGPIQSSADCSLLVADFLRQIPIFDLGVPKKLCGLQAVKGRCAFNFDCTDSVLKHAVKIRGKDVRRLTKRAFNECVAKEGQGAIAVLDEDEHWTISIGDPYNFSGAGSNRSGAGSSKDGACSSRDGACSSRDGAGPSGSGAGSSWDGASSSRDGAGPRRKVTWQESEAGTSGTLRERYGGL